MARRLACLATLCAMIPAAIVSRGALRDSRRALGLDAARVLDGEEGPSPLRSLAAASTALGVIRAAAIDALWLRALRLQRRGDYFEAAALSRMITGLQPRISAVWAFQARHLAYDIPPFLPPGERWPWVLSGIELLRDEALDLNPESLLIHLDLAFIFHHKVGLDHDEAGPLYRSELAHSFQGGDPTELARLARMNSRFLSDIGKAHGAALDLRAAATHSLYWAERGLVEGDPASDPLSASGLRRIADASVIQLFHAGRAVQAPLGSMVAFLPDLRFAEAVERLFQRDAGGETSSEELRAAAGKALIEHSRTHIFYLFLANRRAEAEKLLAKRPALGRAPSLEDLVLESALGAGPARNESARASLGAALEASVLLGLAGEEEFRSGFESLAKLIHAALPGERVPFEAVRSEVRARLARRWSLDPRWTGLAARLGPGAAEAEGAAPPDGVPAGSPLEPRELPFRLDLLDPARTASLERGTP